MNNLELVTTGPEETRSVAAAIAPALRRGDVVSLDGDLGAGKTCFVQGAAEALGVTERVVSPTYVLVRSYEGDLPIVHCDLYRLEDLREITDLGDEPLSRDVVTFIEWGEAAAAVLPTDRLQVRLLLADEDTRRIIVSGTGSWRPRLGELAAACEPWQTREDESC